MAHANMLRFNEEGLRVRLEQHKVSRSEIAVVMLLVRGLSEAEAADQLCVSRRTVKFHKSSIYKKLRIYTNAKLIVWCLCPELLPDWI